MKKKKKAPFELPKATVVKSLPSKRLQKRISPDFVPIFDETLVLGNEVQTTPNVVVKEPQRRPVVSSLPRKARIQPRGEGFRTQYQPQTSSLKRSSINVVVQHNNRGTEQNLSITTFISS